MFLSVFRYSTHLLILSTRQRACLLSNHLQSRVFSATASMIQHQVKEDRTVIQCLILLIAFSFKVFILACLSEVTLVDVNDIQFDVLFLFLFFLFLFNVPVNNFSVMLRRSRLFLGITSTFWGVNVSCSRKQHTDPAEDRTQVSRSVVRRYNH